MTEMRLREIAENIDSIQFIGLFNRPNFFSILEKVFRRMLEEEVITTMDFDKYMKFVCKDLGD